MTCEKCKKQIPDGSAFCNHCGKKQGAAPKKRARKRPQGTGTIRKDERNKSRPWVAVSPSSRYGTSRVYLGSYRTYKGLDNKYIRILGVFQCHTHNLHTIFDEKNPPRDHPGGASQLCRVCFCSP